MIPSTRHQALTALVYRLGNNVGLIGLPQFIRELDRPSRPTLMARKAEEAGIMFGWAVLLILSIVALIPIVAIASTYIRPDSEYQAIGDIASGLPVFAVTGAVLHYLRYLAIAIGHAGQQEGYEEPRTYPEPRGVRRWLLTSGDADLVVQALITIAFVAIRLQVNP